MPNPKIFRIDGCIIYRSFFELAHVGFVSRPGNVQPFFCTTKRNKFNKMKTTQLPQPTAEPLRLNASRSFDSEDALRALRDFYLEVRREIKRNKKVIVSANCDSEMNHLHFIADNFDLACIITERSAS